MISRNVVTTTPHLERVVAHFMRQPGFAYDLETIGGDQRGTPALNTVTWISMATDGMAVAVPLGHPIGDRVVGETREPRADKNGKIKMYRVPVYEDPPEQLDIATAMEILRPLFWSPDHFFVNHETTFDRGSLAKYFGGEIPPGDYHDTKVIQWLLNENHPQQGLKFHTKRLYGVDYDKEDVGKCVEKHPFSVVAHYAYMDALYTWLMFCDSYPRLQKSGLADTVYENIEQPLFYELTAMRLTAVPLDIPRLEEMKTEMRQRLDGIEGRIYKAAGREFNINSNPEKKKALFGPRKDGGQALRPWKKTDKGDLSTDASVLESYPENELCRVLLEYQAVNKLMTSYVLSYLGEEGNKKKPPKIFDGGIYTEAQQHGARTGRFSYRSPNLQNIPRPDKPDGKLIRGAFLAPDGYKLIVADYDQVELRILAHYLGRGMHYEAFAKGLDPHTMIASRTFGWDFDDMTAALEKNDPKAKDLRGKGKTLNFSILYGTGDKNVAGQLGVSVKEGSRIIRAFNDAAPEIDVFRQKVVREARKRRPPRIRTLGGRVRRVPELFAEDRGVRSKAERQIFNSLIQGGSADLTKMAIVRANRKFREESLDALVILTVHDELVVLVRDEHAERAKEILIWAMTGPEMQAFLRVPLTTDAKIVQRWSQAK